MDKLFEMAIIQLDDLINGREKVSSNTKRKELSIDFMKAYFKQKEKIGTFLLSPNNHPKLGHLLSLLCNLAKSDKSRTVRIDAVILVKDILISLDSHHSKKLCTFGLASFFLPGVCSSLMKLIMSDDKLPRELIIVSIQALRILIQVAFKDCTHLEGRNSHKNGSIISEYIIHLDGQELDVACENLSLRVASMFKYLMSTNMDDEVMTETFLFCEGIINISNNHLVLKLLPHILHYCLINIDEQHSKEHNEGQKSNANILKKIRSLGNDAAGESEPKEFNEIFVDGLIDSLKVLPEICRNSLFSEKIARLKLVRGYLICLSEHTITNFLLIEDNRKLLIDSMIEISEFGRYQSNMLITSNDDQVKTITNKDRSSVLYRQLPEMKRDFRFLNQEIEVKLIKDCCTSIGKKCEPYVLFDCLSIILQHHNYSPAAIFITMNLLFGCTFQTNPIPLALIRNVLGDFLEFISSIYLSWEHIDRNKTIKETTRTLHQITLSIESFAPIAKLNDINSKTNSEKCYFLKVSLCTLLNAGASSNSTISSITLTTLDQIAEIYSESSIRGLIETNVDYIVDSISSKLDNYSHNIEIPNVIAIAFKLSSSNMLYYFQDIFDRALRVLDNVYHSEAAVPFAVLFYRIVSIIDEWYPQDKSTKETLRISSNDDLTKHLEKLMDEISIQKRMKRIQSTREALQKAEEAMEVETLHKEQVPDPKSILADAERSLADSHIEESTEDCSKVKELPYHIELVDKIVRRCIHLLSSRHGQVKLNAIKTISISLKVLRNHENVLLPLAHNVWAPLMRRLSKEFNHDLEMTRCSFRCIVFMSIYSGDFIKSRTLSDVMPKVCSFLKSQYNLSKNQQQAYTFTLAYKCQLEILNQIGQLIYHVGLSYSSLWKILEAVIIYLDDAQPLNLQQYARTSLLYMFLMDPDCVLYFSRKYNCTRVFPFHEIYSDCSSEFVPHCQVTSREVTK